jgi:hypothetical protein
VVASLQEKELAATSRAQAKMVWMPGEHPRHRCRNSSSSCYFGDRRYGKRIGGSHPLTERAEQQYDLGQAVTESCLPIDAIDPGPGPDLEFGFEAYFDSGL